MSIEASLRKLVAAPDPSSLPLLVDALSTAHPSKINTGAAACLARLLTSPSSPSSAVFVSQLNNLLSGTQLHEWHSALLLLSVLLQAAPDLGVQVLSTNSVLEQLVDGSDILLQVSFQSKIKLVVEENDNTASNKNNELDAISRTKLALAEFMSTSAGVAQARPFISQLVPVETWLKHVMDQNSSSSQLKAVATIARIKLAILSKNDNDPASTNKPVTATDLIPLYKALLDIFLGLSDEKTCENGSNNKTSAIIVEGLSLLSHFSSFKQRIARDDNLVKQIFALAPSSTSTSSLSAELQYSLAILLNLLTAQKQRFSKEEEAKRHLQKMAAQSKGQQETNDDEDESEDDINNRVDTLLDAGILSPLSVLTASMSVRVRRCVGETLLSLVEKRERRPKVIQGGGVNALMRLISSITIPQKLQQQQQQQLKSDDQEAKLSTDDQLDLSSEDLTCIQALCKLAITTNPILLFSDSHRLNSLPRPFALFILYPQTSSLLQQFESLMALTNLASLDSDDNNLKSTIASIPHFMESLQELLLSTAANGMIRRAAAQLACNLVMCKNGFMFWAGSDPLSEEEPSDVKDDKVISSRLHLLLALCSVDDDDTRIAASGALATLTLSPSVSDTIISFKRAPEIIESLLGTDTDDNDLVQMGLKLRGEEIVRNIDTRLLQTKDQKNNNVGQDDVDNLSAWMKMTKLVGEISENEEK